MTRGITRDKVLRRDALPVPDNLPTKTRCVTVEIPDDWQYLEQLYSVLRLLTKWNSYQQDGGHRAADAANLWKKVLKLSACKEVQVFDGVFVEDCMTSGFRVNPDNKCQLQIWCNGNWDLFWDISSCVVENVKQQVNGEPIADGDCREWDVSLRSSEKWLLPVSLSYGDTVVVSASSGASNDGVLATWYCLDGQNYTVFGCDGLQIHHGDDPAPAIYHQRLLLNVDGVFYDGFNTTTVIPFGTDTVQGFFQINDADLPGNSGTVVFHVKVCKVKNTELNLIPSAGFTGSIVKVGNHWTVTSSADIPDNAQLIAIENANTGVNFNIANIVLSHVADFSTYSNNSGDPHVNVGIVGPLYRFGVAVNGSGSPSVTIDFDTF